MPRSSYYLLGSVALIHRDFPVVLIRCKAHHPNFDARIQLMLVSPERHILLANIHTLNPLQRHAIAGPSPVAAPPTPLEPPQSYYLPITPSHQLTRHPFPSKLWQKAGPNGLNPDSDSDINSWQKHNPSLRHEILSDPSAETYVREHFAKFPSIIDIYQDLAVPILKADFLRQLIIYADGGIWSDLDVTCHVPIDAWILAEYKNATNLVVGIEFDGDQFASWTVMAKPRTAHIAAVIEYIMDALEDVATQAGPNIAGLTMAMIEDVVAVTEPQAMTRAILESVSVELGVEVGAENVSGLRELVLLHDVLVLPNAAFAAMQAGIPQDQGL